MQLNIHCERKRTNCLLTWNDRCGKMWPILHGPRRTSGAGDRSIRRLLVSGKGLAQTRSCPLLANIWYQRYILQTETERNFQFLPARRYASAGYRDRNVSVRLSVCLSVTCRYCVKTKKASVMISSPSGSPKTLVFWRQISSPNFKGFPPERGPQTRVGRKNSAIFSCIW